MYFCFSGAIAKCTMGQLINGTHFFEINTSTSRHRRMLFERQSDFILLSNLQKTNYIFLSISSHLAFLFY